jgi:hypothetical protein
MEARSKYLGNTGLFYIGASLAAFSAIITFFLIPNIKPDAMIHEDILFREYLAEHGFDVSQIGEPGFVDADGVEKRADSHDSPTLRPEAHPESETKAL